MAECVPDRLKNSVGKGENDGDQHFLLFQHYFKSLLFQGRYNQGLLGRRLTQLFTQFLTQPNC